jgi:hypothetical protein
MIHKFFCKLAPFHQVGEMDAARMDQETFAKHSVQQMEKMFPM